MSNQYSRREMLSRTGQAVVVGALGVRLGFAAGQKPSPAPSPGTITGHQAAGVSVGERVLAEGGNAIDAAVAASLAACVTAPYACGPGGYGGHMTLALAGGKKITSIDFNTTVPAQARPDMYPLDEKGQVKGAVNFHGWLAVGVPGTLAGLHLALERYGTRSFRELVQPALEFARSGVVLDTLHARSIRAALDQFRRDPGSAKLFLSDGRPPQAGERFRNPDLAQMLSTLAERNSPDSFYRGDIALRIAEACQKNGGLVTANDLAAYHAREVSPLHWLWHDFDVYTAPLTAGGLTVLEGLSVLDALNWSAQPPSPAGTHAWLEAMRLTWQDRLGLLGDPDQGKVPVARLLSRRYARELAARVNAAVKARKPIELQLQPATEPGTTNFSSADRHGNLVVVTLTQGGTFGAQVTVEGLGVTLSHGMSRFNPRPGHPNSPGPGKRPLHNMCPTIVCRGGRAVLALGGAGGVRIPNGMLNLLTACVLRGRPLEAAMAAPRLHCLGTREVALESFWPSQDADYLKQIGFAVQPGSVAHLSGVAFDPKTGECRGALR